MINNIYFVYVDINTKSILLNKNRDIEYLDFRFKDRVYFKKKGQNSNTDGNSLEIKDVDFIVPNWYKINVLTIDFLLKICYNVIVVINQ